MKLEQLNPADALKPGAEVWIVPNLAKSRWARRIDWYLNFQINRGTPYRSPSPAPALTSVIEKWEFEPPVIEIPADAPLLVASADKLPNQTTIQIPQVSDAKSWAKRCFKIWEDLQQPRLRVFLPEGFEFDAFRSDWPAGPSADVTVTVVDDRSFDGNH